MNHNRSLQVGFRSDRHSLLTCFMKYPCNKNDWHWGYKKHDSSHDCWSGRLFIPTHMQSQLSKVFLSRKWTAFLSSWSEHWLHVHVHCMCTLTGWLLVKLTDTVSRALNARASNSVTLWTGNFIEIELPDDMLS